jgi:hypothetical protein
MDNRGYRANEASPPIRPTEFTTKSELKKGIFLGSAPTYAIEYFIKAWQGPS